jgi:hypothetical protein
VTGETETRLTGEVRAQVAEEIGLSVPDDFDAQGASASLPPPPKLQHTVPDRGRARDLFEQLCALPPGDTERLRIRSELVELHLPLVEYLARRFRNRGEWLDDLTQVATIGLIKSIDRFDLERSGFPGGSRSLSSRSPRPSATWLSGKAGRPPSRRSPPTSR